MYLCGPEPGLQHTRLVSLVPQLPTPWYLSESSTVQYASLRCFMPMRLVVHCCKIRFFSMVMASISVMA